MGFFNKLLLYLLHTVVIVKILCDYKYYFTYFIVETYSINDFNKMNIDL